MKSRGNHLFPILEALQSQQAASYRFHVPAHAVLPGNYWGRYDLTELPGLDHLYAPRGCISEAQALAAAVFKAGRTFFLVNGSSAGLTAAIFALCRSGETLLLGRNSHRSAAAGLIFSGARPKFVPVAEGPAGIPLNIRPADTAVALDSLPEAPAAVLVTSPNYWGICSSLDGFSGLAREHGFPLLVDEAHGGHFIFHRSFPAGAASSGADLWVNSGHKTLGALTPGAYLHLRDESLVDAARLTEALAMMQTTSPPYPVLLSLDLARGWLESTGPGAFGRALEVVQKLKSEINRSDVFQCLEQANLPAGMDLDPLRLTVYWERFPLSGFQAGDLLHRRYRIEVEMCGAAYLVALVHPGLPDEAAGALVWALRDMEKRYTAAGRLRALCPYPLPSMRLTPREAVEKKSRLVPLKRAAGLIAAQLVTPFPPGVPVLYPGEEILPEAVDRLESDLREGVHFQEMILEPVPMLHVVAV